MVLPFTLAQPMNYKKVFSLIPMCCYVIVSNANTTPSLKDSLQQEPIVKSANVPLDALSIPIPDLHTQNITEVQDLLEKNTFSPLAISLKHTHNSYIQSFVNKYLSTRGHRQHLSKMLAQSQYYFPIFESIFKELNIPDEIKYLAIVESALDPNAVSRVGATGPWQFMLATAKGYGLQIDSYIDERKDPIAASYAAAEYLNEAYDMYQDWFLAIASYNCGQGNVNRAIRKSGKTTPTFWDIRPYLPKETRDYVPSFIALYKILSNAQEHGLEADRLVSMALPIETEIVQVERQVELSKIAESIRINLEELKWLNPAYKKNTLRGSKNHPARLILPKVNVAYYSALYEVLQGGNWTGDPQMLLASNTEVTKQIKETRPQSKSYITYKVQEGDTLEKISKRFKKGNTAASLKALNGFTDEDSIIEPGTTLKISWD